jgi:uncharacterized protein (TIGR03437 family)
MKIELAARIALLGFLAFARVYGQTTCISFPANFIPFSSITYVTAANSVGDHLIVGVPAAGAISSILANIPLPSFSNQTFCDAGVQLGPQQFYPNVYVPTAAEVSGNFSAFAGLLLNPVNNQPYPNGVIPATQLGSVFAWRIGAAQASSANRGWSPTGSMTEARAGNAAVLLPSGKVLVVSWYGTSADIYDPTTGRFAPTGQMQFSHGVSLTATLLNDGRVLIVGGSIAPSAVELYDPSSGRFTAIGQTIEPHGFGSTATLLNDGRVLVVGGLAMSGFGNPTSTADTSAGAETFDPKTGKFASAGVMASNRNNHTATLLSDGRVLVTGGNAQYGEVAGGVFDTAEIYDPSTGGFAPAGSMRAVRGHHFAVLLPSSKVLVGGGFGSDIASAELFDPATKGFTSTGGMTNASRASSTATLLASGQVLVAGGTNGVGTSNTSSAELYNPGTGTFSFTGSMGTARCCQVATTLLDGRVLVTGGYAGGDASLPLASAELYTPVAEGLLTSQTGLTFRAAQGAGTLSPQSVAVLSSTDTIPWTVSTHTYTGGNWLTATPSGATSTPGAPLVTLSITANPSGLAAQDYYGAVTLTPTDSKHPPVSIAIVLSIVPAGSPATPAVSPSGLVFLASLGATPKPQSFTVSNLTSRLIAFTATATATPNWFDFSPKTSTTVGAGQTTSVTVTPAITGLTAGVYRGSIKLSFIDNSTQTIDLLLVISGTSGSVSSGSVAQPLATAACTATKLLPVFTTIGTGFNTPAAWPTPIIVQVVDDCGGAVNSGLITVSFSNGDPPLSLLSIGNATWTGTWTAVNTSATAFAVRADAQQSLLRGSVQVTGQVALNPKVPIVAASGIVSSGDYASSPAQGLLVSIFGTALADGQAGANNLPLPQQLGSTSVVVSGEQLPVLYVNENQINVLMPYDLAVNAPHQLIVQRGNAISVPAQIAVFDSQPAILATAGNGAGQGHIYKVDSAGNQILADANASATAGDALVIYTVGLGAVTPPVKGGDPAPSSPPSKVIAPVTVTIGGQSANVFFAGLTPGSAGLYQVNAIVPTGINPGNQVSVTLSVAGKSSAGNIYMGIK